MIKKIAYFLQEKGLTCDKGTFYGDIDGIEVSGTALSAFAQGTVSFAAYVPADSVNTLRLWIESNKRAYGIMKYSVDNSGVYLVFSQYISVKKYLACVEDTLNVFKENCITGKCPLCGEPMEKSIYVAMKGRRLHTHEKCFDDYVEKVQEEEAVKAATPIRLLRGIVGAIVGSLLGCVVWGLLYYIGIIAWIAAVLTAFGASFLWDKFGGKNGKAKIVTVWIVTVAMIAVTMFVGYLIDVKVALSELGWEGLNSFEVLSLAFETSEELRRIILVDTILSLIFIVLGNIFTTIQILKTQKLQSKELRKL